MKKIAVLLTICLCSILSCGQPMKTTFAGENNAMDNEQLLLEKENKSLVQEKKHTADDWTVELTSKLEDTRTKEDLIINAPEKIYAVNRVIFNGLFMYKNSFKGVPYSQYLDIKKIIKEDIGKIDFTLRVKIFTLNIIKLSGIPPLQLLFSDNHRILTINDVEITYQETDEPAFYGTDGKDTIIKANIPLDMINQLRTAQQGITVRLQTIDDDSFEIVLPPIFIEYLKEI